jgi:hypothetical protein
MSYQIRVEGHLDQEWAAWFEGVTLTLEATGETLLFWPKLDQAGLYGVLRKVRDLGLPLVSVVRVQSNLK